MANTDTSRQISRQSMSKLALEYFSMCGICPTITDVMKTTTMLEDYVINGYSAEMVDKFTKLDEYLTKEYKGK